jgi:hypothetical protein
MRHNGVIRVPSDSVRRIEQEVAEANRRMSDVPFAPPAVFMVWVVVCTYLFTKQEEAYASLDAGGWWLASNPVLSAAYVFVCAFGLYAATVQNFCASVVVRAVRRIEPHVVVGVDMSNADGRWGWRPAGVILGAAYRGITVHMFALIAISLVVVHTDFWWWLSIAALALSMGTAPVWIVLPLRLTKRLVKAFRDRELEKLDDRRRGSGSYSVTTASRIDRLNSVPSVPFLRTWNVLAAVGAQLVNVPAVGGFIAAMAAAINGSSAT